MSLALALALAPALAMALAMALTLALVLSLVLAQHMYSFFALVLGPGPSSCSGRVPSFSSAPGSVF